MRLSHFPLYRRVARARRKTAAMPRTGRLALLASVVLHLLQMSGAFQATLIPSAAVCGPSRCGVRCGVGAARSRRGHRSAIARLRAAMSDPGANVQEQQGPSFFAALWYILTAARVRALVLLLDFVTLRPRDSSLGSS